MVFSSVVFCGIFLPTILLLYFVVKSRRWKNAVLLLFSLLFYAWGEPVWVFLMIGLSLMDYMAARVIERIVDDRTRRLILILFIVVNLLPLFLFKYLNFFILNINGFLGGSLGLFPFGLPIGISFFTFQSITYVVDVYRRKVQAQKNPLYVMLYISMFPQLVAGPIVRYSDIALQIESRKEDIHRFSQGMFRFCIGLAKKVVLANYAGSAASILLAGDRGEISTAGAWIGLALYTFQIYFDFSGYSDMAIGLGRMFGFEYRENFRYPYLARSVTEFWRRWHISLSSFFRDYVYIPLGGNRRHQYLNILIVWTLTGFWHGASWNFLLWGLYYALLLTIEKALRSAGFDIGKVPVVSRVLLLFIVMMGWGIFYYTDMAQMGRFFQSLFNIGDVPLGLSLWEKSAINSVFLLIPVMAVGCTRLPSNMGNGLFEQGRRRRAARLVWSSGLLLLSFLLILGQSYNPFLYFRF
jgi:alginate O-acetyltransferase complex protein AlgI